MPVVGNKDAIVLRYPHNGGKAAMLPPALPLKVPSSHMPIRPPLRHPRSSSSDKWVPSSQARELSLSPRKDWKRKDASDSLPHTPVDHTGQVVPSSQSNERELQLSDVLPPASDIYKTPASPLHVDGLPLSPLVPLVEDSPDPLEEGDLAAALPSREVVESSQRIEMGYDANDEFSQSQDAQSQPSTFTPSDPITSPFHTPSRRRSQESAESYPVEPYLRTPSQLRAFVHMFDERDDTGNVLLSTTDDGEADSPAASPSPSSRRMTRPDQSEATPERSRGTKRPLRDLTPPCSYAERPPRSRRRGSEEDLDPSQRRADDSDPDLSSGSSSPSLVFPTPVREFFEIDREAKKLEKLMAKEAQAEKKQIKHALKDVQRAEKAVKKSLKAVEKAEKQKEKATKKEMSTMKALMKAKHKEMDAAEKETKTEQSLMLRREKESEVDQRVHRLQEDLDSFQMTMLGNAKERESRLAEVMVHCGEGNEVTVPTSAQLAGSRL
ncbi:hypothetical protein ACG7TL_003681 [Trametes sanguinea]